MNEKRIDRKWRAKKTKCMLWGVVPVFDFFAFLLMADNSGEEKYKRKGMLFGVITLTAFFLVVSQDILIYYTTLIMGTRAAAYTRSIIIVAGITIATSYMIQLILLLLMRKEYLMECEYADVMNGTGEDGTRQGETSISCVRETERIDLNNCTGEDLQKLPGITAAMAIRIIRDRENNGVFSSVEELIDRYSIKPHFAVRIMEMAFVSTDTDQDEVTGSSSGTKRIRVLDI